MTSPLQQKIKITGPSIVTANRLSDGAVVYRTADGEWTTEIARSAVVATARAALELLNASKADGRRVVDAYLAPVKIEQDRIVPGNLREMIRMRGPTIDLPTAFGI